MTTATNAWTGVQSMIGSDYQIGDNCLYKDFNDGHRIEVTGTCGSTYKRHFNIYLLKDGAIIGESTGVMQDDLAKELNYMCQLSNLK